MKNILLSIIIIIVILNIFVYSKALNITAKLKTSYDSNPFCLSESDIEKYKDGNESLNYIKTRDDIVLNASIFSSQRILRIKKIKTNISLTGRLGFQQYVNNSDKSNFSTNIGLKIDSKKLDIKLRYIFSPNNYIRQYEDLDGSNKLEKYSYDKNSYKLSGSYRFLRKDYILFSYSFEQEFYNKYFSEYDAEKHVYLLGWKHSFKSFYLNLEYKYTINNNDEPSIEECFANNYGRGTSYDSNLYSFSLTSKKIDLYKKIKIRPKLNFSYQQIYYQTELPEIIDKIHSGRKDYISSLNLEFDIIISNNYIISLDYIHNYRKVDASYDDLDKIKDYQRDRIGINLSYLWDFK